MRKLAVDVNPTKIIYMNWFLHLLFGSVYSGNNNHLPTLDKVIAPRVGRGKARANSVASTSGLNYKAI